MSNSKDTAPPRQELSALRVAGSHGTETTSASVPGRTDQDTALHVQNGILRNPEKEAVPRTTRKNPEGMALSGRSHASEDERSWNHSEVEPKKKKKKSNSQTLSGKAALPGAEGGEGRERLRGPGDTPMTPRCAIHLCRDAAPARKEQVNKR